MTRLLAGGLLALLASGCGLGGELRHHLHLRSLMCSDGLPVRLLQDPRCADGICGYTCAPDRWGVGFSEKG
jgi:hypothetical protein